MLDHLQGLTHLDLGGVKLHLRVQPYSTCCITAAMLSGLTKLTSLTAVYSAAGTDDGPSFEAGILAGKPQLQHLKLCMFRLLDGALGFENLLSELQWRTQLTRLEVLLSTPAGTPSAKPYAALTASSKLRCCA